MGRDVEQLAIFTHDLFSTPHDRANGAAVAAIPAADLNLASQRRCLLALSVAPCSPRMRLGVEKSSISSGKMRLPGLDSNQQPSG